MNFWKKRRRDNTKYVFTIDDVFADIDCKVQTINDDLDIELLDDTGSLPKDALDTFYSLTTKWFNGTAPLPIMFGELRRFRCLRNCANPVWVGDQRFYLDDICIKSFYWPNDATLFGMIIKYNPIPGDNRITGKDLL